MAIPVKNLRRHSGVIQREILALIDDIRMRYAHDPRGLPESSFAAICDQLPQVDRNELRALLMTAHTPLFQTMWDNSYYVIVKPRSHPFARLLAYVAHDNQLEHWSLSAVLRDDEKYWYRSGIRIAKQLSDEFEEQLQYMPILNWELYHREDD